MKKEKRKKIYYCSPIGGGFLFIYFNFQNAHAKETGHVHVCMYIQYKYKIIPLFFLKKKKNRSQFFFSF